MSDPEKIYDVGIIGGGIVGLATAYQISKLYPQASIVITEKENRVAAHQTGHNSGVLHSGIYSRPGSLRATNCREGKVAMEQFCREQGVAFDICGKVIVAVNESEIPAMQKIYERGQENGVQCEIIDEKRLKELEPHVQGVAAIHVPEAGIVDYKAVSQRLADIHMERGHALLLNNEVQAINQVDGNIRVGARTSFDCRYLVTCGGLWADRLISLSGIQPEAPIVPFRGEYFEIKPSAEHLCNNLIYPVPDPRFPFLGVHFTRMIHGGVECGPNAVLAFARDGYHKTDLRIGDLAESLMHPGFRSLALKYWQTGIGEMWRSWNKAAFVKALQRLIPAIRSEDLVAAPAGVRAQAIQSNGQLVDDFIIQKSGRMVHIGNAPSPAATASLNIGKLIVEQMNDFQLG